MTQPLAEFLPTRGIFEGVRLRAFWFESPLSRVYGRVFCQLFWVSPANPLLATVECSGVHEYRFESPSVYTEGSEPALLSGPEFTARVASPHEAATGSRDHFIHPRLAQHAELCRSSRLKALWDDRHDGDDSGVDVSRAMMLSFTGGYVIANEFNLVASTPFVDGADHFRGNGLSMAGSQPWASS